MSAAETTAATTRSRQRWTLAAVCVATFMLLVDISIVNVGLPAIQRDFGAGLTAIQWVVDAYALSLAALLLSAGALADRFGRRLVFAAGLVVFTLASLAGGLAVSVTMLDLARAVQGIGGAAMFATTLALIAEEFRGPERAGAIAAWGATVGGAVAVGPLAGGVLTDALGWRWIFLVHAPIGAAALAIAFARVRESRDPAAGRLDLGGLASFSGALLLLVLGLLRANAEGWGSPRILAALAGAVALLVAFAAIERRRERPMLDLALFRKPAFIGVSAAVFCLGAGMFALIAFISLYLQDVELHSPLGAGLRLLPSTALVFLTPLALRRLRLAIPARSAIGIGLGLVAIGLLTMHGLSAASAWTALLPGLLLCGLGIGLANPAIGATAIAVVHPARAGMASGFNNTCRLGGIAVGIAVLGAALQHRIAAALAAVGPHAHLTPAAVASAGERAVNGPAAGAAHLARLAGSAFATGINELFLIGAATTLTGSILAFCLIRAAVAPAPHAPATQPAPESAAN